MRKLLIDTDVGGDDAVALIMALRDPSVRVEAVTTVMGNVPVEQATYNAMLTIERAGTYTPPVYQGLSTAILNQPLVNKDYTIHGKDGMGDLNLPSPSLKAEPIHAVDFLIHTIEEHPGEYELVALGPATNLAWISLRSPKTLSKLKRIVLMAGTGPYFGNATPLAEGNARMDPEALDIVLRDAGTDVVLVGWNLCIHEYLFTEAELTAMGNSGSSLTKFCLDINHNLIELNERRFGEKALDFADPAAMAVALRPELVLESVSAYTRVETNRGLAYGAVAVDHCHQSGCSPNATTCLRLDASGLKKCITELIL